MSGPRVDWRARVVRALNNSPEGVANTSRIQKLAGGSSFILTPVLKALCAEGYVTVNDPRFHGYAHAVYTIVDTPPDLLPGAWMKEPGSPK